eukprot:TRINITY_DN46534_c0_g1_i1.p2 TRINITY_DN46534_c0_g1~~TRINITY_DN46534_c0_g1_i1.p2  ORF type:complete len:542 (+),score=115.80 TRINITY_DN46534_c0_g1_i1:100-1626(+)
MSKTVSLVNKLIFPAPSSSYALDTFPPNTLIWIPEIDYSRLPTPIRYVKQSTSPANTDGSSPSKSPVASRPSNLEAKDVEPQPSSHKPASLAPPPPLAATAATSSLFSSLSRDENSPPAEEIGRHPWETGRKLPALFLNTPGAEFLILFYHGNGEDIGGSYRWLSVLVQILYQQGILVSVLMVEYPGYGLCFGKPSEAGVLQNAESAYYFVRAELEWPVENLWLWGVSIGTGPATFLAARYEAGGLILMAAYESIRDVVKHLLGKAASYLISNRFENNKEIEKVVCPTLLIHGTDDKLIPHQQSQRLHELCKADIKILYLAEEIGHSNFHLDRDIAEPLIDFIVQLLHFRSSLGASIPVPRRVSVPRNSRVPPKDLPKSNPPSKRSSVSGGSQNEAPSEDQSGNSKLGWLLGPFTARSRKGSAEKGEKDKNSRAASSPSAENENKSFHDQDLDDDHHVAPADISEESLEYLKQMGFEEKSAREALTMAKNDISVALELLLPYLNNESF